MIWGNAVNNYNEATMGSLPNSNFSYGYYGSTAQGGRGWNSPNLVTYMESHDEERLMYKNLTFGNAAGTYNTRDLNTALARIELASAFFFTVPGPKMVWQFGELGYDKSIFQCSNGTVPTPYASNDQCKLSAKQPVWAYYQNANRRQLYDVQRALIALKKQEPAFANPTSYTQQLAGAAKSIHASNATQNITVIGNFDVTTTTIDPAFQRTGKWYNYLSGDSITVANANALITLAPGAYAVYTTRRLRKATLLSAKASRTEALRLEAVPNPSSNTASLRYELAMPAAVTVTVHNVLGATVRTISSRATQPAGAHELTLPVQDLTDGIYVVRLSTGLLMQTTRLVVQH